MISVLKDVTFDEVMEWRLQKRDTTKNIYRVKNEESHGKGGKEMLPGIIMECFKKEMDLKAWVASVLVSFMLLQ